MMPRGCDTPRTASETQAGMGLLWCSRVVHRGLQVSGAPLSILGDFGLPDKIIERLFEAGIGTVERLGAMTPDEIMQLPGINAKAMDEIQNAVNGYYGPYEGEEVAAEGEAVPAEAAPEGEAAAEAEVAVEAEVPVEADAQPAVEVSEEKPAESE